MNENLDFGFITHTIQKERCILLLGPDVARTTGNHLMSEKLLERLNIGYNSNIVDYYRRDGLFAFPSGVARTRICYEVEDFYKQQFNVNLYQKLAQIPFHLMLSVSPDTYLLQVFNNQKLPVDFRYYVHTENPKETQRPTSQKPLLYNLFGKTDRYESLILSHNDLYNFLFAILGDHKLPLELRNSLDNIDNFIFLGFRFDKWYVQILLRLLNLHLENFDRYAVGNSDSEDVLRFHKQQFNITFIQNDVEEFVEKLYAQFAESHLRTFATSNINLSTIVEKHIENDEFDSAIDKLKEFFKENEPDIYNEFITVSGRYRRFKRKVGAGTLNAENENTEISQIRESLIDYNKELKELE